MSYAIGIDVGGTNIKTVAVSRRGDLLHQAEQPTTDDRADWAARIREEIDRIEAAQHEAAGWVGLAAPGLAARDGRSIAWMQGRLDAIQGLDWTTYLGAGETVPVLNDAHAALLGEAWCGAAAGCPNVMMLTLGTGVGGGALVDGHLLRGHIGRAGHLGHICLDPDAGPDITGTPGSLEDAIGDCTIVERTRGRFTSTAQLVQAHLAGDPVATACWLSAVHRLGCGLVSLINVLDPEIVILGGGIIKAGPALFTPLQEVVDLHEWRPTGTNVKIVPATLGELAGAVGAAYHALRTHSVLIG
jgi:glucokinase